MCIIYDMTDPPYARLVRLRMPRGFDAESNYPILHRLSYLQPTLVRAWSSWLLLTASYQRLRVRIPSKVRVPDAEINIFVQPA